MRDASSPAWTPSGSTVQGPDGTHERIAARTKIWAAGVQASPLAGCSPTRSGAELDRPGRIEVLPDCTLPGHPEVFVVGDMMDLDGLPGVAEVAMQSGHPRREHDQAPARAGSDAGPFHYRDLGSMATISRFRAVVSFKGIRLSGFIGWLMWLVVHLTFLTGFKNRFTPLLHWAITFIGGAARSARSRSGRSSAGSRSTRPAGRSSCLAQPDGGPGRTRPAADGC